jgi:ABC-2 type transport system ATP-binding protein
MTSAIEVRDLVVERGRRRVLHGISCTVPAGSVTGLLGPSGSGKTTLIRAVVGVQIVRSGTVTVLGEPAGATALRRTVGYVTQAPSVYADLSVRENARYFAALYGLGAAEADRAIADVGLAGAAAVRWSARPGCWCSTSPPWARTRCCAPTCGRSSTPSPRRAPRCWSPAT